MIQMLELANKDFKESTVTTLKEIKEKENVLEINEWIWNLSREATLLKNKVTENLDGENSLNIKWPDLWEDKSLTAE